MDGDALRSLLERLSRGDADVSEAEEALRASPPFTDLGFAVVDHHRAVRQGVPEIVYGPGKTPAEAARIARELAERHGRLLATRVDAAQARAIRKAVPRAVHHARARAVALLPRRARRGGVLIVTAGTADRAVAEEAALTCRLLDQEPDRLEDVGAAGVHRVLRETARLRAARVVVVVAGMEAALVSVVGGLVAAPVVAVPTSTGYGAGAHGFAALLGALCSCAANVCCVNVDDGVGAGVVASLINRPPGG